MAKVDFDHTKNWSTREGPMAALPTLLQKVPAKSILDVGCGLGAWLRSALDLGIRDVWGIDGVSPPPGELLFPPTCFRQVDLGKPWTAGRRFDLALCLEVAEHIEPRYAAQFIGALTQCADAIFFSAACPGQIGQHHVNCQWPAYWQGLFNERGFSCSDEWRWENWSDPRIEPWYRQNCFVARRSPTAGQEARIRPVVNPDMFPFIDASDQPTSLAHLLAVVEQGRMPAGWYVTLPFRALQAKLRRWLLFIRYAKKNSGNSK